MKRSNFLPCLVTCTLLLLFMIGCESPESPHQTIEDVVERIPDVELVPGADNVTMNVKTDRRYSNFLVNVNNIDRNLLIANGTYHAWCIQMEVPISTSEEYTGVKLFSTGKDKWINKVTYIVNNRGAYELRKPGLTWKDIQVAIWVITETGGYELEKIQDLLPSFVSGYDPGYVNTILNDLQQNGADFKPGIGDIKLVATSDKVGDQTLVLECDTAWMINGAGFVPFGQGWGGYYLWNANNENPFTRDLVRAQHYVIGDATFDLSGGKIDVKVDITDDDWYLIRKIHLYIDPDTDPGNAPGQYPFGVKFEDYVDFPEKTHSLTIDLSDYGWDTETSFYIALHLEVCKIEDEE